MVARVFVLHSSQRLLSSDLLKLYPRHEHDNNILYLIVYTQRISSVQQGTYSTRMYEYTSVRKR